MMAKRNYRFTVKLSRADRRRLDETLRRHCQIYNAALQERRDAWKHHRKAITFNEQTRQLTLVRHDDPAGWNQEHRLLATYTLRRLDKAFAAFFRRIKKGEKAGFPRFKAAHRFRTLEMSTKTMTPLRIHGRFASIHVKGLPPIRFKLRRPLPPGQPEFVRITRTTARVTVSLTYSVTVPDASTAVPENPVGLDVGVKKLLALSNGQLIPPREVGELTRAIRKVQRRMQRQRDQAVAEGRAHWVFNGYRKKTGQPTFRLVWDRFSNRYAKTRSKLAKLHQKGHEQLNGWHHEIANHVVAQFDCIVAEDLEIDNLTRSAKGDAENPGVNVAQKSGLNRAILAQGWAGLFQKIAYKAESAGKRFILAHPAHTSQTCSSCNHVDAASRKGETFHCKACGYEADADVNAAINILRRGLETVFGPSGISSAGAAGYSTTGSLEPVRLNPAGLSQHAPQAVTLGSSCT